MRKLHHMYAWLFGYFWLPCPSCGAEFGGHEAGNGSMPSLKDASVRLVICGACSQRRERA